MAGRRPKSAAIKLVTGNPGGRPVPKDEPVPVSGMPEKPGLLGRYGGAEWDRLAALLEGELRLGLADGPHLLGAARAYQGAMEYRERAARRGLPADEWRKMKVGERMQWAEYRKFINDLCLSQGTRARAKVGGRGKEAGTLGDFFARHKTPGR